MQAGIRKCAWHSTSTVRFISETFRQGNGALPKGEAAGAQVISNFDTLLAPFVRYNGLSYKDVKQALQEFVFNINIPTRVGFQTPFTNITLDLEVSPLVWRGDRGILTGSGLPQACQSME